VSGDELREAERLAPAPPVPEPGRVYSFLRLATVDVGPLKRHRDFRLLFVGQGVSYFGSMITYVALPYQAYQLSGSSFVVGLLSLAELLPLLVTAFVGGALADAFDRRRLVQIAELGLALCAGVLVFNSTLTEPRLWVLFVVGAAMAGLDGSSGRRSTRSSRAWSTVRSCSPPARSTACARTSAAWPARRSRAS
jgi:MFS family permease